MVQTPIANPKKMFNSWENMHKLIVWNKRKNCFCLLQTNYNDMYKMQLIVRETIWLDIAFTWVLYVSFYINKKLVYHIVNIN